MFRIHAIEDVRPGERFKIILSGRPKAQQRPRIGRRASNGNRQRVLIYNPSHQAQNEMRQVLQDVISRVPGFDANIPRPGNHRNRRNGRECFFSETTPLKAEIKFFMPRPRTHFRRNGMRSSDNFTDVAKGRRNHISRPDLDNMVKFVLDSMQGVVYNNDSHIVSLFASKSFDNHGGCNGRISIEITNQGENHNLNDESDHDNSEQEVIVILDDDDVVVVADSDEEEDHHDHE
jgi:Holliday junction resolvase